MTDRLDQIEKQLQSNGEHIQQLIKIVGTTNAMVIDTNKRIDKVETNMRRMEDRIGRMEDRIGQMEDRMGRVEDRIGQMEDRMGRVEDRMGRMDDKLDRLIDNQNIVMGIQQEQQKLLDRLAARSITQEADIAELRRIK